MELSEQVTEQIAAANNRFALDLYARLRDGGGNLFLSPFSIFCALAMTQAGAQGETAAQMAAALHMPAQRDGLHLAIGETLRDLCSGEAANFQLHVANAIWARRGCRFAPEFIRTMQASYGALPQEADFNDPEAASATINAWVARQTQERIQVLVPPEAIAGLAGPLLANAIYFKAAWAEPFDREWTEPARFFVNADDDATVPTMSTTADFLYADLGGFRLLDLPYAGGRLSMLIVLPAKPDGLPELERTLAPEHLSAAWLSGKLRSRWTSVYLPRFRMQLGCALAPALVEMGMERAFDGARAQFRGMVEDEDLCIAEVLHQAFVEVNEEGTEAAAATAVIMTLGAMDDLPEPVTFRVDRPCMFAIRDRRSGMILFLGRLCDPRAKDDVEGS